MYDLNWLIVESHFVDRDASAQDLRVNSKIHLGQSDFLLVGVADLLKPVKAGGWIGDAEREVIRPAMPPPETLLVFPDS